MTTHKRPLQDNSHNTDNLRQERNPMSEINTNTGEYAIMKNWARRVFIEPWPELICAVIGLVVDLVLGVVALAYIRNGFLPAWLDEHGHLAWMAAGAVAALFLLGELPGAFLRLYRAVLEAFDRRYMAALAAKMAAPDISTLDGRADR